MTELLDEPCHLHGDEFHAGSIIGVASQQLDSTTQHGEASSNHHLETGKPQMPLVQRGNVTQPEGLGAQLLQLTKLQETVVRITTLPFYLLLTAAIRASPPNCTALLNLRQFAQMSNSKISVNHQERFTMSGSLETLTWFP